ncbi:MAG TPA: GtrA family protein [Alphaproteobacteria bacterium]|jgi:putative flippase GtrA|nr:GtrA family protein [Alphaproteobacteria bacterium]
MPLERLYGRLTLVHDRLTLGQQQFLKFSMVGGVGFVVDAGIYFILTHYLGGGLVTSRFVSSLVFGMTATFLLNNFVTFRGHGSGSLLSRYIKFATANIIGNLLNIGTHALLVENLALFHRIPVLGVVVGTFVGLVFNFIGSKYFVFRRSNSSA